MTPFFCGFVLSAAPWFLALVRRGRRLAVSAATTHPGTFGARAGDVGGKSSAGGEREGVSVWKFVVCWAGACGRTTESGLTEGPYRHDPGRPYRARAGRCANSGGGGGTERPAPVVRQAVRHVAAAPLDRTSVTGSATDRSSRCCRRRVPAGSTALYGRDSWTHLDRLARSRPSRTADMVRRTAAARRDRASRRG